MIKELLDIKDVRDLQVQEAFVGVIENILLKGNLCKKCRKDVIKRLDAVKEVLSNHQNKIAEPYMKNK